MRFAQSVFMISYSDVSVYGRAYGGSLRGFRARAQMLVTNGTTAFSDFVLGIRSSNVDGKKPVKDVEKTKKTQ